MSKKTMFPARKVGPGAQVAEAGLLSDAERRQLFETVYRATYEPLQRYLRRRVGPEEAEEALDDVLLILWQKLPAVPPDHYLPWAYGVARRVLANRRRSAQRQRRLIERLTHEAPPPVIGDQEPPDYPHLAAGLSLLSEPDREVLRLWAWEGLEAQAIAAALGITPNAAALRLSKAKKKLARLIGRQNSLQAGHKGFRDDGDHRS